jgi:hypothetical protein
VIALVFALLLLAAPAAADPGRATAAGPVTTTVSGTDVESGARVTFTGRIEGAAKDSLFHILEDPYPFGAFEDRGSDLVLAGGAYRTTREPKVDTRFRIVSPDRRLLGPIVTVYARPTPMTKAEDAGRGRVRFRAAFLWSPMELDELRALRPRKTRAYFYIGRAKTGTFTRVASARLGRPKISSGVYGTVIVRRTARIARAKRIYMCARRWPIVGMGRGSDPTCGRSTITVR